LNTGTFLEAEMKKMELCNDYI